MNAAGEDSEQNSGIFEGEKHVIAAAHHLVKALKCTKILSNETRALLADLDIHLSTIKLKDDDDDDKAEDRDKEVEDKLLSAQHIVLSLHSSHIRIWDCDLATVSKYLQAVKDVQMIAASLERSYSSKKTNGKFKKLLDQAHNVLQTAMDRLERELIDILLQNKHCFEQVQGFFQVSEENSPIYEESIISDEGESVEVSIESQRPSSSTENEFYVMDLIDPDTISHVKSIADLMFDCGYDKEFCGAFVGFWRNLLTEYLTVHLGFKQCSIEDALQMEWEAMNFMIKKWRRAIKTFVGVYLAGAIRLFDQVLGNFEYSLGSTCLVEASRAPLMCLLNFGKAVLIGANRPEWLFCLLDMHEALTSVTPLVDYLFQEETGSFIRVEFNELVNGLKQAAKTIFLDLGNCIALSFTNTPFANGDVHPLTKYIMNYIMCFADYDDTLKLLLHHHQDPNAEAITTTSTTCPLAFHLKSLTSTLETNLENKSNLYKDCAMKHLFMMNNIHYMVRKISNSVVISHYFGDEWIRFHIRKFQNCAMCYERVTWGSILNLLRIDEKVTRATLKVRCRAFATAFENLYREQTRWQVPDPNLREELRISASKTVIPAYRRFVNEINNSNGEKHIKYTEQDLENYILDLLEGTPKASNYSWKR